MRRLKLIFASISLLAMASCINDDEGYNWIYGTWQAVEFTMCNIEGDTESIDLREISDHILGTISFSHDGVATVRVVYFESKQKRLASEDYEVADEKVFEYQYTINDKYIQIGDYNLRYEYLAGEFRVRGHGKFLIGDLAENDISKVPEEYFENISTLYVFRKI